MVDASLPNLQDIVSFAYLRETIRGIRGHSEVRLIVLCVFRSKILFSIR